MSTTAIGYESVLAEIAEELANRFPKSRALHERGTASLIDGGSHNVRLLHPFPPRIVAASGGRVRDEDGHDLVDLWQGHMANVLGHNPQVVTKALSEALADGFGLQTGFADALQIEVAELLCRRTQAERVRFTTSGTLANLYAIMLSSAHTGRDTVLKVGGGWHGAQPWSLKGVGFRSEGGVGFGGVDSEGLPSSVTDRVVVTRFNDPQRLRDDFERHGDDIACFVVEPLVGAGGFVPASREYLEEARRLTRHYGSLLIFDEVVTGFRFRAGDAGSLYGVEPDLTIFGKVIGGGMPLAAVGGRADILELAGRARGTRVSFFGGTYSAHPATLLAARTMMSHLVEHEHEVYPRLAEIGRVARAAVESAFADEGIHAVCTGSGGVLHESSLLFVHFPHDPGAALDDPEVLADPAHCDVELSRNVLSGGLLLEGVHLVHGHSALAHAHTEADVEILKEGCAQVARRVKRHQ